MEVFFFDEMYRLVLYRDVVVNKENYLDESVVEVLFYGIYDIWKFLGFGSINRCRKVLGF